MTENELKSFIDVVINYFKELTNIEADMGIPFVKNQENLILDHTGLIGISGTKKGGIYITAEKKLLEELSKIIIGATEVSEDDIVDMVGEMANTIAGNVKKYFGNTFMISVPIIIKGSPDDILMKLKPPVFIIPINWNGYKSYLGVGLE